MPIPLFVQLVGAVIAGKLAADGASKGAKALGDYRAKKKAEKERQLIRAAMDATYNGWEFPEYHQQARPALPAPKQVVYIDSPYSETKSVEDGPLSAEEIENLGMEQAGEALIAAVTEMVDRSKKSIVEKRNAKKLRAVKAEDKKVKKVREEFIMDMLSKMDEVFDVETEEVANS